jgi:hypothetical protein
MIDFANSMGIRFSHEVHDSSEPLTRTERFDDSGPCNSREGSESASLAPSSEFSFVDNSFVIHSIKIDSSNEIDDTIDHVSLQCDSKSSRFDNSIGIHSIAIGHPHGRAGSEGLTSLQCNSGAARFGYSGLGISHSAINTTNHFILSAKLGESLDDVHGQSVVVHGK